MYEDFDFAKLVSKYRSCLELASECSRVKKAYDLLKITLYVGK